MSRKSQSLVVLWAFAVFATGLLAASPSLAAYTCEQQMKPVLKAVGDLNFPRPQLSTAANHLKTALAALEAGDEAKCIEYVKKAESWTRRKRRGHDR